METQNKTIKAELLAFVLLIVTAVCWLLYEFALNRVFVISPTNYSKVSIITDKREGGATTAQVILQDGSWLFSYEIKKGAPYPFAMLQLDLSEAGQGVDLSEYDEIRLWTDAKGDGSDRFRLDFRNANPAYFVPNDTMSFKYNEVHFPSRGLDSVLKLSWNDFHVAGWWIAIKNVQFGHRSVDVSNVHLIEFVTPERAKEGKGYLKIKQIELRGKWISEESFFRSLLILWMTSWSLFAIIRIRRFQKALQSKELREQELLNLNQVLSIQSQEFKTKAMRDELTGLLNRHGLRDQLFQAIENTKIMGIHLSVIFVDIDHFKQINDTYGHDRGDKILAVVATNIGKNIRETDIAARWGGEEFLIIAQGVALDSAVMLAEKLRKIIMGLPHDVTCSFGVSTLRSGGSIQETIAKADKALYTAKTNGRNRVEQADVDILPMIKG